VVDEKEKMTEELRQIVFHSTVQGSRICSVAALNPGEFSITRAQYDAIQAAFTPEAADGKERRLLEERIMRLDGEAPQNEQPRTLSAGYRRS